MALAKVALGWVGRHGEEAEIHDCILLSCAVVFLSRARPAVPVPPPSPPAAPGASRERAALFVRPPTGQYAIGRFRRAGVRPRPPAEGRGRQRPRPETGRPGPGAGSRSSRGACRLRIRNMGVEKKPLSSSASQAASSRLAAVTPSSTRVRPAITPGQEAGRCAGRGGATSAIGSPRRVVRTAAPLLCTRCRTAGQVASNLEIGSTRMDESYSGRLEWAISPAS